MMEKDKNLQILIDDVIEKNNGIREFKAKTKTIFDITGVNRRENINSNLLAFYLDKNEEHRFGNLFLKSLCEIIEEKGVEITIDSDYEIYREYNYIDILIASKSSNPALFNWAIIIEHKIHHKLDNDLEDYWNKVKVIKGGNKIGIVLSPWGQKDKSLLRIETEKERGKIGESNNYYDYLDLKHEEWVDKVELNLCNYFLDADNFHLLILKDFFKNIKSMYMSSEEKQIRDNQMIMFQKNYSKIKQILELESSVRNYVLNESINVMSEFGYAPKTKYFSAKEKFFFKDDDSLPEYFRFYFWYPTLVEKGELRINFELHNKYISFGKKFHDSEDFLQLLDEKPLLIESNKQKENEYYHLASIRDSSFDNFSESNNFQERLRKVLDDNFFNKDDGILWGCTKLLEEFNKEK